MGKRSAVATNYAVCVARPDSEATRTPAGPLRDAGDKLDAIGESGCRLRAQCVTMPAKRTVRSNRTYVVSRSAGFKQESYFVSAIPGFTEAQKINQRKADLFVPVPISFLSMCVCC